MRRTTGASALCLLLALPGAALAQTPPGASAPTTAAPAPVALPALGPMEPPDTRGAQGILADVERIVLSEESSGWFLDATHQTALYATVLQTVCQASEGARRQALATLEARAQRAGDPKEVYQQQGRQFTDAVTRALSAQRQRDTLRVSIEGASRDCPFWVTPRAGYDGRQTDRNRFVLTFESGGLLQLRRTSGEWTYGGGGVGRLLAGYGFGGKVTLLAGGEFAGGAMLRPGAETSGFVINYFPAIPVLLRVHSVAWHYDFELAAVSLFQADNLAFSFGTRAGFAVGVSALRTRFFIPWAGAALAYEHYFDSGGRPPQDFIRAGLRVGAVWDP